MACFRFLFVASPVLHPFDASLNSAFCCSVSVVFFLCSTNQGVIPMEWTTPKHEEIDLNCEISSYANAEI